MEDFYVYVLLDPRKPGKYKYKEHEFDYEPFYLGKGKGKENRIKQSLLDKGGFKKNVIKAIKIESLKPISLKIFNNISEGKAFKIEEELIEVIGRRDLKLGPLTNLTDGGEGASNPTKKLEKK